MRNAVSGLNPNILRWARERSGHSLKDIAIGLKKDANIIRDWEAGKSSPTYVQLEKLAYQYYKRPIAIFFFPKPPKEPEIKKSFRTLPEFEIDNLTSDSRYALRQAKAMQLFLSELNDGKNPSKQKIFLDQKVRVTKDTEDLALKIRDYLGVSIEVQRKWKTKEIALENWRDCIQEKGIFVFKRSFKQEEVSGFCLIDEEFPVIYLNNSSSKSRQIFTLLHELSHVLLQENSITLLNDKYIESLTAKMKSIEIFCNRLAAEILVPYKYLEEFLSGNPKDERFIKNVSDKFSVSREVILRRFLDRNIIDVQFYEKNVTKWAKEYKAWKEKSKESGGGNWYSTQITYLGRKYINLAFSKYYQGKCSFEQLAEYLDTKIKNLPEIEHRVFKGTRN